MYELKYPDLVFHQHKEIPIQITIYDKNDQVKAYRAVLCTGPDVPLSMPKSSLYGLNYNV